jgi:hypothetical protein
MSTMPEMNEKSYAREDFTILFAKVNESGMVEIDDTSRHLAEQAETIRMLAQATEERDFGHIATYYSA